MSPLQALIIGLIQGLTEFLPISSSAHLKLAKFFFGIEASEDLVSFDLVCHLGTLIAVLFFFRTDILRIFRSERSKIGLFFIATLPLIPCYFLLKPLRDIAGQLHYLGPCLIVTAFILFFGQYLRLKNTPAVTFRGQAKEALWIGTLQSAALIPGISRSASTIACARILGWTPQEAIRFSFLLSIPTIMGGNAAELLKHGFCLADSISFASYIIGFLSSLGMGVVVIRFAVRFLEKGNLTPFAWYCLALGICAKLYLG